MRIATCLSTVALLCMSSITIGEDRHGETTPKADQVYPAVYKVSDLPVWTEGGEKLDATVLIALIKATVVSEAWDESSSIAVYPANLSLVVFATSSGHRELAKLLKKLRETRKSEQRPKSAAVGDQAAGVPEGTAAFTYYGTRGSVVAPNGTRGRIMLGAAVPANARE